MALSEEEQRLLEQMEAALAAEDPKLASTLRGTRTRRLHRRRAALAGVGFVVGLAALIAGMEFGIVVSILGFAVMLAATILALTSWQRVSHEGGGHDPNGAPHDATDFIDRLEERWRRRQDEGL